MNNKIPFVESLPHNWLLIPNKYLFQTDGKKVGSEWNNYSLLSLTTFGVKCKDINACGGKVPESYDTYQTVKKGQIIFCLFDLDCSAVFSGVSQLDGMITSAYDVFSSTGIATTEFVNYWFKYVFSGRYYKMYSKNIRFTITADTFKSIVTPVPPVEIQHKISKILKKYEENIDKEIENQKQQIDLLKEYKDALITKSLFDGTIKDSTKKNVEYWFRKIPSDWTISTIGCEFKVRNEKVSDTDFLPLSVTKLPEGVIPQMEQVAKSDAHDSRKLVRKGDFVINSRSDRKMSCGLSNYDGSVSLINIVLVPSDRIVPEFCHYLFKNPLFAEEFYKWGHGIVADLWTTNTTDIKRIAIPVPPKTEQIAIVSEIGKKCHTIEELISKKMMLIEKIQQYKTSILYEYITGKKEATL